MLDPQMKQVSSIEMFIEDGIVSWHFKNDDTMQAFARLSDITSGNVIREAEDNNYHRTLVITTNTGVIGIKYRDNMCGPTVKHTAYTDLDDLLDAIMGKPAG